MKALPLWQPWASLVAVGAKRIETRHWAAPAWLLGKRVAIHAAKTTRELRMVEVEPFRRRLLEASNAGTLVLVDGELPLGALVATAVIDRCTPITSERAAELHQSNPDEYAFGNYSLADGQRYAWVLRDVEALAEPIPFIGRQGIFDVPDELLTALPATPGRGVDR